MFSFTNADILNELKKSNEHFAELFIQNEAMFIPIPQSGHINKNYVDRYVAQINDVILIAQYNSATNAWTFRSFIMAG